MEGSGLTPSDGSIEEEVHMLRKVLGKSDFTSPQAREVRSRAGRGPVV